MKCCFVQFNVVPVFPLIFCPVIITDCVCDMRIPIISFARFRTISSLDFVRFVSRVEYIHYSLFIWFTYLLAEFRWNVFLQISNCVFALTSDICIVATNAACVLDTKCQNAAYITNYKKTDAQETINKRYSIMLVYITFASIIRQSHLTEVDMHCVT